MLLKAPDGASINSIIAVARALGHNFEALRSPSTMALGFGGAADQGVKVLESGRNKSEVLHLHTMAPLLTALQDPEAAERMIESMLTSQDIPTMSLRDFGIAPYVRRCPACVQEDVHKYGFAFARVIHQLVPVALCPTHSISLQEVCAVCGNPFAMLHCKGYRSMGHGRQVICACTKCGSTSGVPLTPNFSEGSRSFVDVVSQALHSSAPLLRPPMRLHIIAHAASEVGACEDTLKSRFASFWGCSSYDQAASLACMGPRELINTFLQARAPYTPYHVISTLSFAMHILREKGIEYVGEFSPLTEFGERTPNLESDSFTKELCARAAEIGMPVQAAELLAKGCSVNTLRSYGYSEARLCHHLEVFEPKHLREIRRRQERRRKGLPICEQAAVRMKRLQRRKVLDAIAAIKMGESSVKASTKYLRVYVRKHSTALYNWMRLHDRAWFEEMVPASGCGRVNNELTIESARKQVMDGGAKSIPELRVRSPKLFQWLCTNDLVWLQKTVPSLPLVKGKNLTTDQVRRLVVEAFDCGATREDGIRRYASAAKKWARSHDDAWFRKVLHVMSDPLAYVPSIEDSSKAVVPLKGIIWARNVLKIAMSIGLVDEIELRAHSPNAYALILASDSDWLDRAKTLALQHRNADLWGIFFIARTI